MYNIIDNVYLFTCIMGKLHNIATGVMITWAILGLGKEAFSQTTGNSNGKANVGQVQKNTSKQILWIDDYDYQKMLYMDISLLSPEVAKKVMFERINEIRKEYNLPALIYNNTLDSVALAFAKEKHGTERRKDPYWHYNKEGDGPYERMKKSSIWSKIELINVSEWQYLWASENISTTNWSIYSIMQGLMNSPMHKKNILSIYTNHIWIGYDKKYNTLVQNFCNLK